MSLGLGMLNPSDLFRADVVQLQMLEGNPNGPRILEIANTNSKAIACPRVEFQKVRDEAELGHPGVYILVFDPSTDENAADERIYIGETDDLRKRLSQHVQGDGRENWDWNWFIAFTARDLSLHKAHVKYLEARMITLARDARRADLIQSSPEPIHLDRSQQAICERFLHQIRLYCPLVGIRAFDKIELRTVAPSGASGPADTTVGHPTTSIPSQQVLHLESPPDVSASGASTADGEFVVFKGSTIRKFATAVLTPSMKLLRERILDAGVDVLPDGRAALRSDERFNSPSQAASVMLAYRVSGWDFWKDASGRTMSEIEAVKNLATQGLPIGDSAKPARD